MPRHESRAAERPNPSSNTSTSTTTSEPAAWRAGLFDYQRLDAYAVAKEALVAGDCLARQLPRGYAKLADQLRRALLSAHLGVAEAASRTNSRARTDARGFDALAGEASEAAAALEAVLALSLAPAERVEPILHLCARLCAMLTRLAGVTR